MAIIDVHTHFIPSTYFKALDRIGVTSRDIGFPLEPWEVNKRLELMDANDIRTEMLSLSSPSVRYWQGQEAADLSRKLNEELAEIVRSRPARFGALATLPLPDVSRVVTGFDLPFFPPAEISASTRILAAFKGYSDADREMIRSGNALRLFPRLVINVH